MDFKVELYEDENGHNHVRTLVRALKLKQPVLAKAIVAGMRKMQDPLNHKPKLSEHLEDNLLVMRVGFTDIARVFYTFAPPPNRKVVLLCGYVKKDDLLRPVEIAKARRLMTEYRRRYYGTRSE